MTVEEQADTIHSAMTSLLQAQEDLTRALVGLAGAEPSSQTRLRLVISKALEKTAHADMLMRKLT